MDLLWKTKFTMVSLGITVLVIISVLQSCYGLFHVYPKINNYAIDGDAGEPLILTPLIEAGKIEEAQKACNVKPMKGNITSCAGYLTVNKTYNSNMFFWFFPALQNNDSAPIVLWLQGGPGASSLFGLFSENGPFSVNKKNGLKLRNYAWTNSHSVIYIDNPVGTGFSFTDDGGYSTNEVEVGRNLYSALIQFFTLFPQYQKNDFFVTGESYGGKYVPAISYTIHTQNPSAKLKINLKGLAIGNGLCDPEHMLHYGDYLYQIGLLDSNGREVFHEKEKQTVAFIQQKKWKEAFQTFDLLLNGDLINSTSIFYNLTGFSFYFNYLHTANYDPSGDLGKFFSHAEVRRNIHVGNVSFSAESSKVEQYLLEDVMQSVKPWVETLLENYRVLIYNGQLDIIVAYPLTEGFLEALNWSGATDYKKAPRNLWHVGENLAGYSKVAKNLTVLLVRNAGHMVPMDQPIWGVDLITRFTRNKPF